MYENKKTFESILVLIVDLCSLIISMGLAFWLRYGIFYGRFEHGNQIWLLPENPAYQPIDGNHAQIIGKVKAVIRTY